MLIKLWTVSYLLSLPVGTDVKWERHQTWAGCVEAQVYIRAMYPDAVIQPCRLESESFAIRPVVSR